MTDKETLLALADRCTKADAAYQRILDINITDVSPNGAAIAAAMILSIHGHLFKEAAAALRAKAGEG